MIESSAVPAWLQVAEAVGKVVAFAAAGVWASLKLWKRREHAPRLEFVVDVRFVGRQAGQWLVELVAELENKGVVRQRIREFTFDLRVLNRSDSVGRGDQRINHQAAIPHRIQSGNWVPESWEWTFIEPGLKARYSFVAGIPEEATFVLLHGKFSYEQPDELWGLARRWLSALSAGMQRSRAGRRPAIFHTADRLVAVPTTVGIAPASPNHLVSELSPRR